MAYLDTIATSFSIEALIAAAGAFVTWIFDTTNGPVKAVLDVVTGNQILWVFLGLSICTIGVSLLKRLRSIF